MPDFPFQSPSLEAFGPTIEVEVRVSSLLANVLIQQRKPVSPPVAITAVIDTGATWCLFTPDVYARLGIQVNDVATIATASNPHLSMNVYTVDVVFPGSPGHRVPNLMALEAAMSGVPAQGLIGRNLLKSALFTYDGRTNRYSLSF